MDRQRLNAVYTIPTVLPEEDRTEGDEHDRTYQSLGARGFANLVSKMVISVFPPGFPWAKTIVSAKAREVAAKLQPEQLLQLANKLYLHDLQVQTAFDSTQYRVKMRALFKQMFVVGNGLVRGDYDDVKGLRFRTYRLDNWVTRRDGDGDPVYMITKEKTDALKLTAEQAQKAGINTEQLSEGDVSKRMVDMLTMSRFEPSSKKWLLRQEIGEKIVNEFDDDVNHFIATRYEEIAGEDYGEGLADQNIGDLRGFNGISKSLLEGAAAASRLLVVNDPRSGISNELLANAPQGKVVTGRVNGGDVDHVAFLQTRKLSDFQFATVIAQNLEKRLGKALLLESEIQPQGDRVTATQINRLARELQGALGEPYSATTDELQRPLHGLATHLLVQNKVIQPLSQTTFETRIVTGLEALNRETEMEKLRLLVDSVNQLGDQAKAQLDMNGLVQRMTELIAVDPIGLIKSPQRLQEELQATRTAEVQKNIANQAIETGGHVIENQVQAASQQAA